MEIKNQLTEFIANAIKGKESTPVGACGMHIRDIGCESDHNAEIIYTDLAEAGMKIEDVEKKIKAVADKNRKGNFGFCPPMEADRIIREHFGLAAKTDEPITKEASEPVPEDINLFDYM